MLKSIQVVKEYKGKTIYGKIVEFYANYSQSDNGMKSFDVDRMLTQLKKVYAEKAVRSGFEDDSLYNDNLLTLTTDDASMFNELNAIVGKTQKQKTSTKIIINENGLTDEEYEQAERAKKKPSSKRTPEEIELLEKQKEAKKQRKTMISILRGVSIRIPMMIYGMPVDLSKDITIEDFVNEVMRVLKGLCPKVSRKRCLGKLQNTMMLKFLSKQAVLSDKEPKVLMIWISLSVQRKLLSCLELLRIRIKKLY